MSDDIVIDALKNEINKLKYNISIFECAIGYFIEKFIPEKEISINSDVFVEMSSRKLSLIANQTIDNDKPCIFNFKLNENSEIDFSKDKEISDAEIIY